MIMMKFFLLDQEKVLLLLNTINDIKWKRKSLKFYKLLFNFYKKEILKCTKYR